MYLDPDGVLRCVMPPVVDWPKLRAVPAVHGYAVRPALFILHMFSGRRRGQDCHDWLAELAPLYFPDYLAILVSMDMAIHGLLGDLSDGSSYAHFMHLVNGGFFCSGLTRPPCETWTAARHLACDETRSRAPRPLRSHDLPCGLPGLSQRELAQVGMGTHLILNSFNIEVHIVLAGRDGASGDAF